MATAAKKIDSRENELRRWCIEAAMRWPSETINNYGAGSGGLSQQIGSHRHDVDLIGRAEKIRAWLSKN